MTRAVSEDLFASFCASNGIECTRIPTASERTPDFSIRIAGTEVVCEVKQINMNPEDEAELRQIQKGHAVARYTPPRLRSKLKKVSGQLKDASVNGLPTLLVVYDNTPFKNYTEHSDVVQAMYGEASVAVSDGPDGAPTVSSRFFGGNRGMDETKNTSVSAVGILDGIEEPFSLRVYHNQAARVTLDPDLFAGMDVTQPILPDTQEAEV